MAAIRFLNTVAAGVHSSLFNSEASLRQVLPVLSAAACSHQSLPGRNLTLSSIGLACCWPMPGEGSGQLCSASACPLPDQVMGQAFDGMPA